MRIIFITLALLVMLGVALVGRVCWSIGYRAGMDEALAVWMVEQR